VNNTPSGRTAVFHFVENFQGKGPRVIILVGTQWTDAMRRHYGITRAPFYSRQALKSEPSTDATGHPWGWITKPEEMLLDEQRWSTPQTMQLLRNLLLEESSKASNKEFA
jgi:hypothetical protein